MYYVSAAFVPWILYMSFLAEVHTGQRSALVCNWCIIIRLISIICCHNMHSAHDPRLL